MGNLISDAEWHLDNIQAMQAHLVRLASAIIETSGSASPSILGLTVASTSCAGLTLFRHTAPTAPDAVTYEPSIAMVIQGRKRADLGETSFVYDRAHYLLTSLDLPVTSQVMEATEASPYLCMHLKFRMPLIRDVMSRSEMPTVDARGDAPAMATGKTTIELLGAFSRLLELAQSRQDTTFLAGLVEREIIYRILQGGEAQRLRAIATLGDHSQRTARAVAWIMANYVRPLNVERLAELAGMGVSTLHRHFKALTTMSPLQYQKNLRLHAARRRMLMDGIDAASAAYAVGYESASQFNREYSRLFGKPPVRDVQTLLSTGMSAAKAVSVKDPVATRSLAS